MTTQTLPRSLDDAPAPSSLLLALVAAVGMATIGVISRVTGLPAESITFYRLGLGAACLLAYLLLTGRAAGLSALQAALLRTSSVSR